MSPSCHILKNLHNCCLTGNLGQLGYWAYVTSDVRKCQCQGLSRIIQISHFVPLCGHISVYRMPPSTSHVSSTCNTNWHDLYTDEALNDQSFTLHIIHFQILILKITLFSYFDIVRWPFSDSDIWHWLANFDIVIWQQLI